LLVTLLTPGRWTRTRSGHYPGRAGTSLKLTF